MTVETELDRVAFDSFLLALRVISVAFEIEEPATSFEKPFELLRDIAEGKLTVTSPGELGARFPGLKQMMYDAASSVIEHDRVTATRVLRGLSNI
jgi:hypothetical protein